MEFEINRPIVAVCVCQKLCLTNPVDQEQENNQCIRFTQRSVSVHRHNIIT